LVGWIFVEVWYLGLDHVDVEGLLNQKISNNSLFIVCCVFCIQVIMLLELSIYTYIYIIYIAYMLALPASMTVHNVFHVSLLKKYIPDANHFIDWNVIQVEQEGVLQVHHVRILDRKRKQLWNRAIQLVKVQWTWYGPQDVTWENEHAMWA
jgi:hypothetical protein